MDDGNRVTTTEPGLTGVCVIACGALAHELVALKKRNNWHHLKIQCLPPSLHNRPEKITEALRREIEDKQREFEHIFVAFADCGTAGRIDELLEGFGVERLAGAHCYEVFAGSMAFNQLAEGEPGTFYLTDFLTRHFDRLVVRGLGLDKDPTLMPDFFGNYRRVVYLSQSESTELQALARQHAAFLGLAFEHRHTGPGGLARQLEESVGG